MDITKYLEPIPCKYLLFRILNCVKKEEIQMSVVVGKSSQKRNESFRKGADYHLVIQKKIGALNLFQDVYLLYILLHLVK